MSAMSFPLASWPHKSAANLQQEFVNLIDHLQHFCISNSNAFKGTLNKFCINCNKRHFFCRKSPCNCLLSDGGYAKRRQEHYQKENADGCTKQLFQVLICCLFGLKRTVKIFSLSTLNYFVIIAQIFNSVHNNCQPYRQSTQHINSIFKHSWYFDTWTALYLLLELP